MSSQRKITASEKKLFFVSAMAIAFICAFGAWRQWLNAVPEVQIPTPQMPSPNAYDFYVKAGAAIIFANPPVDPTHDPKVVPKSQWKRYYPTAKKEAWLYQNATALNLLRQGFQYPCRVPPRRSFSDASSFGSSGKAREMARMLRIESHAYQERGNWQAAADSALDILTLGHDLARGGILVDHLIGAALNAFGRRELWEILPHLNAAESLVITQKLEQIVQSRVSYVDVLREEKYSGQARLLELMQMDGWRTERWTGATGFARLKELLKTMTVARRQVLGDYSQHMDAFIAEAEKPYIPMKGTPPTPQGIFTKMISFGTPRMRWAYGRDDSGVSLLLVALALRAHKLEHKRYPKTLNDLVPRYLKKVPADCYGGNKPFHYQLQGTESRLYSIGPDGIDNRGHAIQNTQYSKSEFARILVLRDSKGDIVAGINQ